MTFRPRLRASFWASAPSSASRRTTLEQAREAARLPIDYLAIGPIFETSSKENPDPVVGLEGLRRVRQIVGQIPLVAIGGVRPENLREVLAAGADSVAVISLLLAGDPSEIESRTRAILAEFS